MQNPLIMYEVSTWPDFGTTSKYTSCPIYSEMPSSNVLIDSTHRRLIQQATANNFVEYDTSQKSVTVCPCGFKWNSTHRLS